MKAGRTFVKLVERYPPELNNEGWPKLVRKMANDGGFSVSDIDLLILTQVRRPTIELVMQDLGLPMERKAKPGDLVVLVASGVGYNMAGAAFRMV